MPRTSKLVTAKGKQGKTAKALGAVAPEAAKAPLTKSLGSYQGKEIVEAGKVVVNDRELNQIKLSDGSISILTDAELAQ